VFIRSKRSKACDISQEVKRKVWERDHHRCIYCGSPYAMPNAHYLSRAHSGLGIEQNIVTLCQDCHHNFDNGKNKLVKQAIKGKIEAHLKRFYPDWSIDMLKYKKGL
jgi:5-methylcytosine-specific restriction endonuclease McrA